MNWLLVFACLTGTLSVNGEFLGRIHTHDGWLVDDSGRVRIFHGFNSVQKGPPWYDATILNETRLEMYREWGFNVVRLGSMWTGAEPTESRYNRTYLGILKSIVVRLAQSGMYTILDMHQDVASTAFASYDGFPRWLIDKLPPSPHLYPWPLHNITDENWADGYLTEAVSRAFQFIYNNHSGSVDAMTRFWTKIASVFKNHSSVLGYELINEPWCGDVYSNPEYFLPGIAGRRNLAPLYEHLNAGIRSVDAVTPIFYEPVTWGIYFNGEFSGSGFDSVPGGPAFADRSIFSYHYYCWILGLDIHKRYPMWQRLACDGVVGEKFWPTVMEDVRRLGGSSFLTEFGLCEPDGDPSSVSSVECEFVLARADDYFQSWTYWDSTFFNDSTGAVNWNVVHAFARVYARAIAGIPISMKYDPVHKTFDLKYNLSATIDLATEIFVPKIQYPEGFEFFVCSGLQWKYDPSSSVVYVTKTPKKKKVPTATLR